MSDTVRVKSLQDHTYNGKAYPEGTEYDIDASLVDSIEAQGKAKRVEASAPAPKKKSKDD